MNLYLIPGELTAKFYFWRKACLIEGRRGIFSEHLVSEYPQLQRAFRTGWFSDLDRCGMGCPQSAPCGFAMIRRASCGQPLEGQT